MGNISVAFGKVTISAPTFSDIEVLVATLSDIPMSATFDYVDAESGVNFIYKATVMTRNVPGKGVTTELLTDEDLGDYSESYLKELEGVYDQELALATSITV